MQITYRQFPHPVLSQFDNGYKTSKFNAILNTKNNEGYININIDFMLNCESIQRLISDDMAHYVIHLECKATRFRKVYRIQEAASTISIESNKVSGEIEVCILIAAKKDILGFTSEDFIDDFKGIKFDIEKGEILATDLDRIIEIEKVGDLDKVPSIFSITYDESMGRKEFDWEPSGNRIIIKLSKDNFYRFQSISKHDNIKGVLAMGIIIPVLTELIMTFRSESEQEYYSMGEDEECYKIIEKRLINIGFKTPESLKRQSATSIAYMILENLLNNSFIAIEDYLMEVDD